MITPVILSGGSGSRLWPISRESSPKQFHKIDGEHTLLQRTLLRLNSLQNAKDAVVVCNEDHRFVVTQQLEDAGVCAGTIYLEQIGRNTLPAIMAAALAMAPDELMLVLPADHYIDDTQGFCRTVEAATKYASDGALVCFGAVPTKPETGYGYIIAGGEINDHHPGGRVRSIAEFIEKPGYEHAQWYIEQGAYWNSGMFLFRADAIVHAVRRYQPSIFHFCGKALRYAERDKNFVTLNREFLLQCPSISIDHGVMEHIYDAVVVELASDWNDVGSWNGVWQSMDKTTDKNVVRGNVYLDDVKNCCVVAETRLVAALGLDNHIIVETADAVLVASQDKAHQVKDLISKLKTEHKKEVETPTKVHRPWGYFESLETSDTVQVKRLVVNPGARLSLQRHEFRSEHWVVVSGIANVVNGKDAFVLRPSESTFIPVMTLHQLENPGNDPLEIIEVQTGSYFGEDDIERFADDYGRACHEQPLMAAVS